MNTDPTTNQEPGTSQPPKPTITARQADFELAKARHAAVKAAEASGGDPAAIGALMLSGSGSPIIAGREIKGVKGNSYTVGCMVALELLETFKGTHKLSPTEEGIAWLIIIEDPGRAWEMLQKGGDLEDFFGRIHEILFKESITQMQLREINQTVHTLIPSLRKEEDASFTTPATAPASAPQTTSAT